MDLLRRMKGSVIILDISGKVVLGESSSNLANTLSDALDDEFGFQLILEVQE